MAASKAGYEAGSAAKLHPGLGQDDREQRYAAQGKAWPTGPQARRMRKKLNSQLAKTRRRLEGS